MPRIKELDSVRGLAALAIVFFHLWFPQVVVLGLGVNLFFVLSGYLITTIILGHTLNPRFLISFYARRGLRIWPIYYLSLAGLVLLFQLLPLSGDLSEWPSYLTYIQGLSHYWSGREPTFPLAFQHTWSLAIEEQFYLFWPMLIGLVGRRAAGCRRSPGRNGGPGAVVRRLSFHPDHQHRRAGTGRVARLHHRRGRAGRTE